MVITQETLLKTAEFFRLGQSCRKDKDIQSKATEVQESFKPGGYYIRYIDSESRFRGAMPFSDNPKPTKCPIGSKTHLANSPLSTKYKLSSEVPLFQKQTFSDCWRVLRFWNNGPSEQWGIPDLESDSSEHKFSFWTKSPKLKSSPFNF